MAAPGRAVRGAPGPGAPGGPGPRSPAARSCLPPRGFMCRLFHLPSFFFPQIEADFRLNGECVPRSAPSVPTRRPPSPAPGRSRAEDRHGVPETKSRLLAYRPHCSHRASSRPPFPGSQHPQITAFPRGGNGDPVSLVAGSRAVLLRRDSSRESRLVDGRDLVSAPFSFSLSSPFSACVFLSLPRLLL